MAFLNGWTQHERSLTSVRQSLEQKWQVSSWISVWSSFLRRVREYIGLLQSYVIYFFIRASILLFVLRLLSSYKKWQQNLVYGVFAVNFIVTAYTCVAVGLFCRSFTANWMIIPNSTCFSIDVIVITNQVNASQSLPPIVNKPIWNVQMRASTKRILNVLFGLSLVTVALSIGRAATIIRKTLTEDTTCGYTLFHFSDLSWWLKREHDPIILFQYAWN